MFLKRLLGVLIIIFAMAVAGGTIRYSIDYFFVRPVVQAQAYCMEDAHLRMGEIVDKYKETIDGDQFYYVVIAGKIDGKYHTRDIQVSKWMWIHTYRIGDYWSPSI